MLCRHQNYKHSNCFSYSCIYIYIYIQIVLFVCLTILFTISIIKKNKKSNHIINSSRCEENYYAAMRLKQAQTKGQYLIVLYYSDNRPKVVTNELGRPYEHRHHQHPLFAMRCIVTPRPTAYADTIEIPLKFLLTFLQLLIRFHVIHSSTILHLSDSFRSKPVGQ